MASTAHGDGHSYAHGHAHAHTHAHAHVHGHGHGHAHIEAHATASAGPHSRSKSLLQSWRNRPKSVAVIGDDTFSPFEGNAALKTRRMSIDELRFASLRGSLRGHASSHKAAMPWPQDATGNNDVFADETRDAALPTASHHLHASTPSHGTKAIKGMIRRASVSLHNLIGRYPPTAPADTTEAPSGSTSSHFLPKRLRAASHTPAPSSHSHSQAWLHFRSPSATPSPAQPTADPHLDSSHAFPSWRRLRQAASFRHSRVYDSDVHLGFASGSNESNGFHSSSRNQGLLSSYDHTLETMPASREMFFFSGNASSTQGSPALSSNGFTSPASSSGPPVIPPHTGGAARAAAAAAFQMDTELWQQQQLHQQHQYYQYHQYQQPKWPHQLDELFGNDRESGIGIAVTSTAPDAYGHALNCDMDTAVSSDEDSQSGISKVDFIAYLPVELSVIILSQLDAAGLATAARVSRKWNTVVRNQHIWRESFLHEKTGTYATSAPVRPGAGQGVPVVRPSCDWREIYRVKEELDRHWKEGKTRPVYLNGHSDSIYCLQFDENKIITGSRDRTIRIWDMHTLECRLVIGPPSVVHDAKLLIGEDGQPAHYVTNAYHTRSSCSMPAAVSFPMHHSASILCLQYDDRILVTGSSDSTCIVYSVKSGYRPVRRLRHHSAAVLDLCFDERHIVTCSKDISICVWDRETGAMLKQLRGHSGPVNAVQMRGNTIVSCSGDFRVKLWNLETGRAIRELTGHTKGLACSQFSEDGRFVASAGNDRVIRIWDANTGECVREMKAHENLVRSLHIDSVSGRLVSGSYDRDIKVFDMETGQQLLDFPQWHQSWVLSAKSDYRRIVSTGQDPKVLVMDFGAGIEGIEMLETVDGAAMANGNGKGNGNGNNNGGNNGNGGNNICGGFEGAAGSEASAADMQQLVTGMAYI